MALPPADLTAEDPLERGLHLVIQVGIGALSVALLGAIGATLVIGGLVAWSGQPL
jgi:hypothetical protein